jgi:hypothetical protein
LSKFEVETWGEKYGEERFMGRRMGVSEEAILEFAHVKEVYVHVARHRRYRRKVEDENR